MNRLPPQWTRAYGLDDPFGAQIKQYRQLSELLHRNCLDRLKRHRLQPDVDEIAALIHQARQEATVSVVGLLTWKLRHYTARKIEEAHKPKPVARESGLDKAITQLEQKLRG